MRKNNKKRHLEDHEESWAVSYADLLMVLMSFFIVFFNLESGSGDRKEDLVDIISKSFTKEEVTKAGLKDQGAKASGRINSMEDLQKALEGLDVKAVALGKNGATIRKKKKEGIDSLFDRNQKNKIQKMRGLLIELPDDVFSIGAYKLNSETKTYIDQILEKITSYSEKIAIVAIGHADAIPMRADKKIIDSNFILSSLRASKAVEYIVSKGYNKNWVFGQAVSVENRATRSLSLRIYER